MKVYFTASPRARKLYTEQIGKIYEVIKSLGYVHTSDFIVKVDLEKFYNADNEAIVDYYKSTTSDLKSADIVVLEMSTHSLAVGHLANMAINLGKPVIALHTKGNTPFFLQGIEDEKVQIVEYDLDNVREALQQAFEYAQEIQDARFNFFISPKLQHYLDWVSKKKMTPRAVHLRNLLEKDMEENKEYKEELAGGK